MPKSTRTRLAVIVLAALLASLAGLRWGLPNQHHVNTYNCDENTPIAHLQSMDPGKLDFNPVGEKTPYALGEGTFHLYTFAASLKALSVAGLLTLTPDKDFYYANPGEWGKFYLAGRALSALYGALAAAALCLLGTAMFGPAAGFLAGLFLALAPAHSIFSRYLVMNVPGLFWIVLTLLLLKRLMDSGETRFYLLAAVTTGLAVSTRYSAAPLLLPFLAAHLLGPRRREMKPLLLAVPAAAAAFFIGTPYALLDYPGFIKGTGALANTVSNGSSAGIFSGLLKVWASLREGLGVGVAAASLAGLGLAAFRRTKNDLLLAAWTLPLLVIFVKAGQAASSGRMLPVLPFLALLGARLLAEAGEKFRAAKALPLLVLVNLLVLQAAAARLALKEDSRDSASGWLLANARPGAVIGLLREPSWFGPGVLERKYRHPSYEGLRNVRLVPLGSGDWRNAVGYDLLGQARPDLVVTTDTETAFTDEPGLLAALDKAGYAPAAEFRENFSLFGLALREKMPELFFKPARINIYAAKGKN